MSLEQMAYNATSIMGFAARRAPRPECCSDARHLCPRCASAALDEAGITANCGGRSRRRRSVLNQNEFDPDDEVLSPASEDVADDDDDAEQVVTNRNAEPDDSWCAPPPMFA